MTSLFPLAIMLCTVLPALYLGGWFTLNEPIDYVSVFGMFLATGAVLWLVFYLIFGVIQPKMQTKRMRR